MEKELEGLKELNEMEKALKELKEWKENLSIEGSSHVIDTTTISYVKRKRYV